MKKILKKRYTNLINIFILFIYSFAQAVAVRAADNTGVSVGGSGSGKPILENPLGDKNGDLGKFLMNLLSQLSKVAALLAVFMIIYSGFQFVVARGNPAKIDAAKKQLAYVLIGTAIIFGANILINIVVNTISGISG